MAVGNTPHGVKMNSSSLDTLPFIKGVCIVSTNHSPPRLYLANPGNLNSFQGAGEGSTELFFFFNSLSIRTKCVFHLRSFKGTAGAQPHIQVSGGTGQTGEASHSVCHGCFYFKKSPSVFLNTLLKLKVPLAVYNIGVAHGHAVPKNLEADSIKSWPA